MEKIYLINLDKREDRLQEFYKNCPLSKSQVIRFSAIDGQNIKTDYKIHSLFKDNKFGWLRGKIGCALSHYTLWSENYNEKAIIVLEDDITFVNNFKKLLKELKDDLPKDWDYIPLNMEYYIEDYNVSKKRNRMDIFGKNLSEYNKTFYKVEGNISKLGNFGTCSYMISSSGMKKLLEKAHSEGIKDEVDNFINHTDDLQIFLPKKYLITHSSFGGTDVTFYGDRSLL